MREALANELTEYRKMRYVGDCKCGECQLIPLDVLNRTIAALRQAAAPGVEPVAMLGGINGVSLMRHIKAMQPKAQADYHTPLYKHPPSDERAKVIEALTKIVDGYGPNHGSKYCFELARSALSPPSDAAAAEKGQ